MRRLVLLLVALLAALAPCLYAQRMVAGAAHFGPMHFGPHSARGEHSRAFFYPLAYGDPFYSDYGNTAAVANQPPAVILQTPPPAPSVAPTPAPSQPLMIELHGDRYVRISGEESSEAQIIGPAVASASKPTRLSGATPNQAVNDATLPIAVLLFHDGHREEATSYTIADGVLYINASPYTGGPWIRKIELASLDLPETISFNQSRGIKFQVPSAPNEVLVGP
jgi:hypothetical protein